MSPRPTLLRWRALTLLIAFSAPPAPALLAQAPAARAPAPAVAVVRLTEGQLETLLGPVALYPDALIALILPAATAPSDVVLAARYLAANGDPAQADRQAWDESVRSLVRFPAVLKWLDENLAWTKQVGEAFLAQPAEVMQAVQRLRARARAAGTLVDTPQQKIVSQGDAILIEPAQPAVIYVPVYDPAVVYVSRPIGWNQPALFFGTGFAVGSWLNYDCDWRGRTIWVGDWRDRPRTVWVRPEFPGRSFVPGAPPVVVARPWQPPAHRPRPTVYVAPTDRPVVIVNPRPVGEPRRPYDPTLPRRPDGGPRQRPTGFDTPANPPGTILPPSSVVMPPPHFIGAPPENQRRERPTANPDRPRPETPREPRPEGSTRREPRNPGRPDRAAPPPGSAPTARAAPAPRFDPPSSPAPEPRGPREQPPDREQR